MGAIQVNGNGPQALRHAKQRKCNSGDFRMAHGCPSGNRGTSRSDFIGVDLSTLTFLRASAVGTIEHLLHRQPPIEHVLAGPREGL